MKKIKVLVVDDSLFYRAIISKGISSDPQIKVIATASDPFDARDKILRYNPDVITCDVEMPKMDGIKFVQRLIPQYPVPVIMVTTISESVFDAIRAGAVDFVTKPDVTSQITLDSFIDELIIKVKTASQAKVSQWSPGRISSNIDYVIDKKNYSIIAIGASTGGTEAIYSILRALPNTTPGIVIVQHLPAVFSKMFAERLNRTTSLKVKEAQTGDYVQQGHVFLAPGDKHMKVKKIGDKYKINCFEGEKVNGHRPSVDVLFESIAQEAGNRAIGIILTGMGYDGAKGLLSMKNNGARTIGQDEKSSVVYGMPKVAFNIGAVEAQVSLKDIPHKIYTILTGAY
ncbi:MAG: protein-glutamate methylesterase/protein-glutamine glutaminase [Tepidanaerobacteraceae bacterium]|jgi:two-component system chemotaxis response regulator CheB